MDRNELRAAIFAAENKRPRRKTITLFGQKVDVVQPTVNQITKIGQAAQGGRASVVNVMIEYCYVPGTDQHVFDPADQDGLLDMPTGPWLTEFNEAVEELTSVAVQVAEKNSEEAPSDSLSLQ